MITYLVALLRRSWRRLVVDPTLHPYLKSVETSCHVEFVQHSTAVSPSLLDTAQPLQFLQQQC